MAERIALMSEIKVPVLSKSRTVPFLEPGAMAHSKPFPAGPEIQARLGFPDKLVPDWEKVAVNKLGDLVKQSRALRVFLDSSAAFDA